MVTQECLTQERTELTTLPRVHVTLVTWTRDKNNQNFPLRTFYFPLPNLRALYVAVLAFSQAQLI